MVIQPLSTRLIKPNFCFDLSHRRSTTVSLETRNSFEKTETLGTKLATCAVSVVLYSLERFVKSKSENHVTAPVRVASLKIKPTWEPMQ